MINNTMKLLIIMSALLLTEISLAREVNEHANIASPDKYQVLLENEQVLVLRMTLKPGESDNWHKHNAETVYFEQGGKAKIKTSEADFIELDIPNGFVMWHDSWQHQVFNIGNSTITAIIVERK